MKKTSYGVEEDLYTTVELTQLFGFFRFIESQKKTPAEPEEIIRRHNEYRSVVRNKVLERKYDALLHERTGLSIHEIVKQAEADLLEEKAVK